MRTEEIDRNDIDGEDKRAADHLNVARGQLRAAHTKHPKSEQRKQHARIHVWLCAFAEKQRENRNDYDIQRSDEGLLARGAGIVTDAELLQTRGYAKDHAANGTTNQQIFLFLFRHWHIGALFALIEIASHPKHQQRQRRKKGTARLKGESTDVVGTHILCHKAKAPNHGGQK